MKTYWYAAGLKGGGVMVFSAPRKYTKISARQLRTRFTWLSKPYASQRDAAVFLGQKVGFRNPPQKITVLHQGKITVQHLSDPKRKSNPKQQTIMTRSQGLTYLMQRYSITKKEAADTWDYVIKPGMHDENIRMTADNVARQCDILDRHKNPARTSQPNPPKKYHEEQLKHYKKKLRSASGKRNKQEIAYYQGMVDAEKASLGYEVIHKHKRKKNPPQFMEVMFQKWKQQCQRRHPNGNVQGNAYGAKCFNQEGDRMGAWNGEDGWVA